MLKIKTKNAIIFNPDSIEILKVHSIFNLVAMKNGNTYELESFDSFESASLKLNRILNDCLDRTLIFI